MEMINVSLINFKKGIPDKTIKERIIPGKKKVKLIIKGNRILKINFLNY